MVDTILTTPLVQEIILPFVLVFVVLFAILQKTKILGDGKRQIDALVSLAISLIFVSFGFAVGIIAALIPFLAVSVITILVFMLIYGMVFQGDEFKTGKKIRTTFGVLAALGVVIVLLVATGVWEWIADYFLSGEADGSNWVANIVFIVVIVGAILVAVMGGKSSSEKKS